MGWGLIIPSPQRPPVAWNKVVLKTLILYKWGKSCGKSENCKLNQKI
jgi:hypothetical protein